jgi:Uma2 family endonuclease
MNAPMTTRVNAEEYFRLPETTQPTHLIDGEIIEMTSPTPEHQSALLDLAMALRPLVKGKNGTLFVAPLDVRFDDVNVVQPDLIILMPDSQCVIGDKRLIGAPDLIVEVLSPSTTKFDRKQKFHLYERFGVREYWLVNPREQLIEVWLHDGTRFVLQDIYAKDETVKSGLLGEVGLSGVFG